jgi:teichoic acid transport system permease protein
VSARSTRAANIVSPVDTTPASSSAGRDPSAAHLRPLNAHIPVSVYLRQMWERRAFAIAMPMEEVRSSNQNTLLGNVWHLFNPMLSVAVYYLVFGVFLSARGGIDNYVLWLMIGVFSFGLTQRSVLAGATSITTNAGLMRSMRFPRALLPLSVVVGRLLTFGFELAVISAVAIATGEGVSMRWLALPLVIIVQSALNLGGAYVAARLNDSYRDIQQLIPFFFRLLMYVSGVMFPIAQRIKPDTNPWIRGFVDWNPVYAVLQLYRYVFLGTPVNWTITSHLLLSAAVLLVLGFRFFRARELEYGRA